MSTPKVSVILLSYNNAKYITESIESILFQTYPNIELIIADDYSSDNSIKYIRKFCAKYSNVRYIQNPYNMGISVLINNALKEVTGEYIALQSSDDISVPSRIKKQVEYMEENKNVLVTSSHVIPINDDGKFVEKNTPYERLFHKEIITRASTLKHLFIASNFINSASQMFRKTAIDALGLNYPAFFQLQDFDYNIRALLLGDMYIFQEPLLLYRIRDDGNNVSINTNPLLRKRIFIENYLLMDAFLTITDVDFFNEIFHEYTERLGTVTQETIPYFLGRIAIKHGFDNSSKLWGYKVLYNFFNKEGMLELVRKKYGFTYAQFMQLAKEMEKILTK